MSNGFTLIEMLVVLAIIGIITLVVIVSQGSFNKSLILSNAAYDVALAVRSAESYGIASRIPSAADTHYGYGLEFTKGSTFTFFIDSYPASPTSSSGCRPAPPEGGDAPDAKWGNCVYDVGNDTVITTYTLNRGITVNDACAYTATAAKYCVSASTLTRLDVSFVRPSPIPVITKDGAYDPTITSACLTLVSPQGGTRYVSVAVTGEIDANAQPCP